MTPRWLILPNFGLGDMIQLSPVFPILRQGLDPAPELHLAAFSEEHIRLAKLLPGIDRILSFPLQTDIQMPPEPATISRLRNQLAGYDRVFYAVPPKDMGRAVQQAQTESGTPFFTVRKGKRREEIERFGGRKGAEYQFEVRHQLGLPDGPYLSPRIIPLGNPEPRGEVLVWYDTSEPIKSLPSTTLDLVMESLQARGLKPTILIGPQRPGLADRYPGIHRVRIQRFTEAHRLLSNVSLAIGPDSGIGHLAAAWGRRTLLLFGPTDALLAPLGPEVLVVQKSLGCRFRPGDQRSCLRCTHPEHSGPGEPAFCMDWFRERDLGRFWT